MTLIQHSPLRTIIAGVLALLVVWRIEKRQSARFAALREWSDRPRLEPGRAGAEDEHIQRAPSLPRVPPPA